MYIVDRFEGNWTVVEGPGRATFNLPRDVLPSEIKEGDVIEITVAVDKEKTVERKQKAKSLLNDFFSE
jgi:Protein of unknown function (DUF3006)